jgi:hypothetical protein
VQSGTNPTVKSPSVSVDNELLISIVSSVTFLLQLCSVLYSLHCTCTSWLYTSQNTSFPQPWIRIIAWLTQISPRFLKVNFNGKIVTLTFLYKHSIYEMLNVWLLKAITICTNFSNVNFMEGCLSGALKYEL